METSKEEEEMTRVSRHRVEISQKWVSRHREDQMETHREEVMETTKGSRQWANHLR